MSKRIILCADGTWQTSANRTNVSRLYKALTFSADQAKYYDDGVGADGNPISRVLGGAFGTGLWNKIKNGYAKLAQVYMSGDEVYLFGFSRGAYTARSLAGMIAAVGLPRTSPIDSSTLPLRPIVRRTTARRFSPSSKTTIWRRR